MEVINDLNDKHVAYWTGGKRVVMKAPPGMDDCSDCTGVMTDIGTDDFAIHVAWRPDEIELAHLAQGGVLWLTTYGSLPPHVLSVQSPWPESE